MAQKTSIGISIRLRDFLINNTIKKQSYEETIWRLLNTKTFTKEQSREIKSACENSN